MWVTATDYLTPTTLAIADVSGDAAPETLKSNPTFFDATTHVQVGGDHGYDASPSGLTQAGLEAAAALITWLDSAFPQN